MAVPKKRTGHSAQGHRRSNWKATKPDTDNLQKALKDGMTALHFAAQKGHKDVLETVNYKSTLEKHSKP